MQCLPIFVPHEKMYNMLSKTSNAMQLFFFNPVRIFKGCFILIQIYSRPFKCNYIHSFLKGTTEDYERELITCIFDVHVPLYGGTYR